MKKPSNKTQAVAKLIHLIKSEDDLARVLDELFTDSEIDKVHERIKIVACLSDGLSQRATVKKSGAAIATVTRGASLMKKPQLILSDLIKRAQKMSWWQKLIWRA